jgi:integrase
MNSKTSVKARVVKKDSLIPYPGYVGLYYRESPNRVFAPKGLTRSRQERALVIKIYKDGKFITETQGWESEVDFNDVIKRLGELRAGSASKAQLNKAHAEAMTMDNFWDEIYKPQFEHDDRCKKFWRHITLRYEKYYRGKLGAMKLMDIKRSHVDSFWKDLNKTPLALATKIQVFTIFRQVVNYAIDRDIIIGKSPFHGVKMPTVGKKNRRLAWFRPKEALTLLNQCLNPPEEYETLRGDTRDLHDAVLLIFWTGLRAGELVGLKVVDSSPDTKALYLLDTKNGQNVPIPLKNEIMGDYLVDMLKGRVKEGSKPGDFLFPSFEGKANRFSDRFRSVLKRHHYNDGIEDRRQKFCLHTTRHTAITWNMIIENGNIPIVKEFARHEDIEMTMRYTHVLKEDVKEVREGIVSFYKNFKRERANLRAIA